MRGQHHTSIAAWGAPHTPSPQGFLQGPLHLLVAEAVDERIQHGGDDAVEGRDHCVSHWRVASARSVVVQVGCHEVQSDHKQVGRASGEGFVQARSHRHPKDSSQYAEVGDDDKQEGAEAHKNTSSMESHFNRVGVAACCPQ